MLRSGIVTFCIFLRYSSRESLQKVEEFLVKQMLTDSNYRLPSIADVEIYSRAGVKSFLYYQGNGLIKVNLHDFNHFRYR